MTLLHLAAQFSSAQVVKALICAGADLEALDDQQSTPLHLAAEFDQSGIVVKALIKAGANVEARDKFRDLPLHKAARYNQSVDVSMALITAGADVNCLVGHSLRTPLHLACLSNPGIVSSLLKAGAWVNILNIQKQSPLLLAAWKNHKEAVFALLAHGADVELGISPLLDSNISSEMKSFLIQNIFT